LEFSPEILIQTAQVLGYYTVQKYCQKFNPLSGGPQRHRQVGIVVFNVPLGTL